MLGFGWRTGAAIALTSAVACGGSPSGPDEPTADFEANGVGPAATSPIDVSGAWDWSREEIITLPDEFAFIFGIQAEGPVTHLRCHVVGVITLVQQGAALSGVETETASRCETRGGQVVVQPGLGVPIPIHEGQVKGRAVELLIGDAVLPCPIKAVIDATEGVLAVGMRGTGRCFIPGHPKSEAPPGSPLDLPPPPGGTEKIVTWEATRPS